MLSHQQRRRRAAARRPNRPKAAAPAAADETQPEAVDQEMGAAVDDDVLEILVSPVRMSVPLTHRVRSVRGRREAKEVEEADGAQQGGGQLELLY